MIKLIFTFLLLVVLPSCMILPIPHDDCDQPEVTGTVLNIEDDRPVPDVNIEFYLDDNMITAKSDVDGKFVINPVCKRKIWMIIAMDPAFTKVEIILTHPEYKELRQHKYWMRRSRTIDFDKIHLMKNR